MIDEAEYGSLPFEEQIRFFLEKLNVPTERWADVWKDEHDTAFMVAGAMGADLLYDLREAVESAIVDGTTLADFRKRFDAIIARYGWVYHGGRDWRTRVIFDANLRSSYQAGRWAQIQDGKAARPYLLYRHSDISVTPRPLHVHWDGLVLGVDDPWWRTHFPPNGWGCKCRVFALSDRDLQAMGKQGPDPAPEGGTYRWVDPVTGQVHEVPLGIDPGWDYAPGATRTDLMRERTDRKAEQLPEALAAALRETVEATGTPRSPPISTG